MYILGISAYFHDSSIALLKNDEVLFAASEERFTRIKNDSSFPIEALSQGLKFAQIELSQIDEIVFYEKPLLKYERILETQIKNFPKSLMHFLISTPLWFKSKLNVRKRIKQELREHFQFEVKNEIQFSEHHLSHAASAFFPSPFQESSILCLDGVGEWATATMWTGRNNKIERIAEINFPDSLGLFYSAFTSYCGFEVNSGEYKLMGLASYGNPVYEESILKHLITVFDDGSFQLNHKLFGFNYSDKTHTKEWEKIFGVPALREKTSPTVEYFDIAASAQKITEDIILRLAKTLKEKTNSKNLCLAGGVALNCVANGKLIDSQLFNDIWIHPAAGDDGGALGAALAVYYLKHKKDRVILNGNDMLKDSLLGPEFERNEIYKEIERYNIECEELSEEEVLDRCSIDIANQLTIGWFQGRMEFGPRALGNRSILCDPRGSKMKDILNIKVKKRETFRPFGPIILREYLEEFIQNPKKSPYMQIVQKAQNHRLASVIHVDDTVRYQTIEKGDGRLIRKLLEKLQEKYQLPALLNTSFNLKGEPIICTPNDAIRCFAHTDLDILYLGNFRIEKVNMIKSRIDLPRFQIVS